MRRHLRRGSILVGGIAFLALGVVGLVLPFLQGILFIFIGLILLSMVMPRMRAMLERHTVRYPHLHALVLKVEKWVVRIAGEA